MTVFADMYHPALGNVHITVPNDPTALALYESHGWVLSTGGGPDPTPIDLTVGLGDLRYAKLGDIPTPGTPTGDALRAAFVPSGLTPSVAQGRPSQFDLRTGVYNMTPSNFRRGRSAIARGRSGLGLCDIVCYGDSRTQGNGLATLTKSYKGAWPGLLRTRLTTSADGGVLPIWDNLITYDDRFTLTGAFSNANDGPFARALTKLTAPGSISFTGTFDSLGIITIFNSGNWTYQLDGGAAVPVTGTANRIGSTAWCRTVVSAGSLGQHTVQINWTTGNLYIGAFEPRRGTTGFRVHSIAHSGLDIVNAIATDASGWNSREAMAAWLAPDIGIVDLAINSFNTQLALGTFKSNTQTLIDQIGATGDTVLVAPFDYPASPAQSIPLSSYISTYYDLADANNLPLIDLNWWFKSDAVWPGNPSGYYADGIHFKDVGHWAHESVIARALGLTSL